MLTQQNQAQSLSLNHPRRGHSVDPDPSWSRTHPRTMRPSGLGLRPPDARSLQFRRAFPLRHSFSRLCVPQISFHSLWQFARPRRWNRPIPRHALVWPNTGSMI